MPEHGQVLTFTRSMQVDGNTPLALDLRLAPLPRPAWGFSALLLLAAGVIAAMSIPRPPVA
jgi:hypothetical protein